MKQEMVFKETKLDALKRLEKGKDVTKIVLDLTLGSLQCSDGRTKNLRLKHNV